MKITIEIKETKPGEIELDIQRGGFASVLETKVVNAFMDYLRGFNVEGSTRERVRDESTTPPIGRG